MFLIVCGGTNSVAVRNLPAEEVGKMTSENLLISPEKPDFVSDDEGKQQKRPTSTLRFLRPGYKHLELNIIRGVYI